MSQANNVNREMFILGEPLITQFGEVRFLTYAESLRNISELNLMGMNVLHFYYEYKKQVAAVPSENKKEFLDSLEELKEKKLYEFILEKGNENLAVAYYKIFKMVLHEDNHDNLEKIFDDENLFMGFRDLVMDMNFVVEDPTSINPEIQEYYDERKKQKQKEAGKQTVSDIVTSIVAGSANSFNDVRNWTVIQVYYMYYRIAAFKNFDSSILFATVDPSYKVESWSKNVDLFKKEELGINYEDFNKKYGGLFD